MAIRETRATAREPVVDLTGDDAELVARLREERLLSDETRAVVQRAIDALPPNQRLVITMRDVEGWPAEEVCNVLSITETNQRVLLHRARSKVRAQLERYLEMERV
jgi:RNA polymerase sigma-70 factor, ECF subfamily